MPSQRYKRSLHIAQIIERPADRARARAPALLNELTDKFLPNNKATRAESRVRRSRRIKGENPVAEPHAISHQANPNPAQDPAHAVFSELRAQRKDIPPVGPDGRERNFEQEETLMMMEYYANGSLDQAIRNNQEHGFPKRVLWHLFDCSKLSPSLPAGSTRSTNRGRRHSGQRSHRPGIPAFEATVHRLQG